MSGGGALNLSLLSRGVGEVQRNGHEKVEVFLEPSVSHAVFLISVVCVKRAYQVSGLLCSSGFV